jgi:hypothetical protein
MTPKEKAKDLVDKFDEFTVHYEWREKNDNAIECALIAVDEVLKYQPYDVYTIEQCNNVNNYWREVKKEIEKL